jgi:hypothetical protein
VERDGGLVLVKLSTSEKVYTRMLGNWHLDGWRGSRDEDGAASERGREPPCGPNVTGTQGLTPPLRKPNPRSLL